MRLTTDGLIIREKNIKDDQRLVVALTAERGLITAFVSGVRRMKSRTSAPTQLLCYSSLTFFKGRGTYRIDEAALHESFFALRQDLELLSLAQYFCELSLCLAPEEEEAKDFLRLMLLALHYLSTRKRPQLLIKPVTELRMLSLAGYMPNLTTCAGCEEQDGEMSLDLQGGQIFCSRCNPGVRAEPISPGVLAALRHIVYAKTDKLFSFTLPGEGLKQLSDLTEKYLLVQADRTYRSLDFFHQLTDR